MNRYLIPANSKKSMMILGFLTMFDAVILGIGIAFSVAMLAFIKSNSMWLLLLELTPGLVALLLVMPVPPYHNVMTLIGNIYRFYTGRRQYYWKGWCVCDDPERRSSRRKNF